MTLYDELETVLDALDRAPVDYALVGGLAVAIWGAPPPQDIADIQNLKDIDR